MKARDAAAQEPNAVLPMVRALAQLHELVALVDSRSNQLRWLSPRLAALCGVHELPAGHWLDALTSAETPASESRFAEVGLLAGEPVVLRTAEGASVPARLSAARIEHRGCDVTALIFRLDEPSSARNALRLRGEALTAVLAGVPDGVVILDHSRFVTWANPAMSELTGYAPDDLLNQPVVVFLRSREDVERLAESHPLPGAPWRGELEIRRRDGRPVSVRVDARPLLLDDGTDLGTVAYVRDVTDRRLIQTELERRAEELQNWVNAVSHDLRSPLVAVLGFARLLHDDYGDRLDDQGRRFLRRIEEAGRTMESLVHDLLEFARIGRNEPKREVVDPREVMLQLQAELKPRLEEAAVSLHLPDDPPLLYCDRTQLYQVLSNLVANALDHAGPSRQPRVEVEVLSEPGRHHITVRDFGRGIEPGEHERIFEIFQTHGIAKQGRCGTGIGLAIVRKVADSHGGAAWVESHPGQGSTFHVTFASA
jgi:PAS domain S-box-containing protein